jgi:hypothetical protein
MASGLMFGYLTGIEQASTQREIGYRLAVNDVRNKLDESGAFMKPGEMKSLLGQVTDIGADYINFKVDTMLPINPLDEQPPAERRVLIDADTQLVTVMAKSLPEILAEKKAFNDAIKKYMAEKAAGKDPAAPPPPSANSETMIKLSDISRGDSVMVAADHDILRAPLFLATKIRVVEMPVFRSNDSTVHSGANNAQTIIP